MSNKLLKPPENPPKLPRLKPKQLKFLKNYLKHGNATQAYKDAGYSDKGASQSSFTLLSNTDLQRHITHHQEQSVLENQVIYNSIVPRTNEITRKAERDEEHNIALKGLDQLSKLGGLYDKKLDTVLKETWTGIEFNFATGQLKTMTKTVETTSEEGPPEKASGPISLSQPITQDVPTKDTH